MKMMNYWKTVDAGDFKVYTKKFLQYYIENKNSFILYPDRVHWSELKSEFHQDVWNKIPEMKNGLFKFGQPKEIAVITLWNANTHIVLNAGAVCRMTIPIANTRGSRVSFFSFDESHYKNHVVHPNGTKFWPNEYRNIFQPVANLELTEPTIVRSYEPHTTFFDSNEWPRISLLISFEEDLKKYLDEV